MIRTLLLLVVICGLLLTTDPLSANDPDQTTGQKNAGGQRSQANQPNIVFLLADDLRPDAISALGHPLVQTPNLDRLVRSGTCFTRAISAYPICHISRAEIYAGRSAFQSGYYYRGKDYLPQITLLPEALRAAGYHTWYVGKWHSPRTPWKSGFEETHRLFSSGGAPRTSLKQVDYKGRTVTGYRGWTFKTDGNRPIPSKGVGLTPDISEEFADGAIELIRRKVNKPFFLQVSFTAPHDPLLNPTGLEKLYPLSKIPLPRNFLPKHPFDHGNLSGRDEVILPWPRTQKDIQSELAVYYRVITHLDRQIGRIIKALKQSGKWENTILIFSSDHGLALGSHGLTGKQNQYEHSIGVPLIFCGKGIAHQKNESVSCYLRDLYPTICDLTGTATPESVQSRSLKHWLCKTDKKPQPIHEFVIGYFTDTQRMIRKDDWKLIWYPKLDRYQLFDLKNDPDEMDDQISQERNRPRIVKLKQQLTDWLKAERDPLFD